MPGKLITSSLPVDRMTFVLEAVDLYRFYHAGDDETLALRGVSLTAAPGRDRRGHRDRRARGKSTLLACLAGLDEPSGGVVRVLRRAPFPSLRAGSAPASARSSIGMLFQSGNLLGHLDVRTNVLLAQRLAGRVDPARVGPRCSPASGSPATCHVTATPQLSGGELARAGLAVALANEPQLLLADEPTGELDTVTAAQIVALLRERAAAGTRDCHCHAQRRTSPRPPTASSSSPTDGSSPEMKPLVALLSDASRSYGAEGARPTRCARRRATSATATASRSWGLSGSGKSTLLHLIAGLDVPTSGRVDVAGVRRARRRCGPARSR